MIAEVISHCRGSSLCVRCVGTAPSSLTKLDQEAVLPAAVLVNFWLCWFFSTATVRVGSSQTTAICRKALELVSKGKSILLLAQYCRAPASKGTVCHEREVMGSGADPHTWSQISHRPQPRLNQAG